MKKAPDAARIVYMHDVIVVASIKAALHAPYPLYIHYMCPADIPPHATFPEMSNSLSSKKKKTPSQHPNPICRLITIPRITKKRKDVED
jgi:hypothetical protein